MTKKVMLIFGTRPEAIKMAPIVMRLQEEKDFEPIVCLTAQHRQMLDQVINFFNLPVHYDLNIMRPNQSLYHVTARVLEGLEEVLSKEKPGVVLVQGDTTSTFAGALAAFYQKIPVGHVEAGLRSHNKFSPYPEEMNRKLTGHIADFHFTPTEKAAQNIFNEGIKDHVYITGNTVIDALLWTSEQVKKQNDYYKQKFSFIPEGSPVIMVTGHRRESFGEPFRQFALALKDLALKYPHFHIVYPVHLNPNVQKPVKEILSGLENVHLIEPVDYPSLVWLLNRSYLVITDSGGIQEEAPSLGKPVLVTREVTERTEGVEAGTAKLVGTDRERIVREASRLIEDEEEYQRMAKAVNPYGDGTAAVRIVNILKEVL